jgi:prepilin-type N-terminal cleavage/methylation domain-containing protein/prepilin-type processing-associated H-X9-DG protein
MRARVRTRRIRRRPSGAEPQTLTAPCSHDATHQRVCGTWCREIRLFPIGDWPRIASRSFHPHSHTLKPTLSGRGFTLLEVLVVVAIIVALAGISVPISRSIMQSARERNCASNLRQIGVASMLYASDNQMTLPVTSHQRRHGGKSWTLTLQPYASGTITFKCPKDPVKTRGHTYVINDFLTPHPAGAPELNYSILARISRPEAVMMFAEASETYQNTDHFHFSEFHGGAVPDSVFESQVNTGAHSEKANYLFADGHMESLFRADALAKLKAANSAFIDPSHINSP